MNNQEYLIQILLKLRSIGIKNDEVLAAIEKTPPHFIIIFLIQARILKKLILMKY